MKRIIILAMFLLLLPTAFAALDDLDALGAQAAGVELPGAVKSLFGNEIINIEVTLNEGGTETISVTISEGVIGSLERGALEDPTMLGWVDETTLRNILTADDKLGTFMEAKKEGTARYKAIGFFKKIKVGIGSLLLGIFT